MRWGAESVLLFIKKQADMLKDELEVTLAK